MAEPLTTTMPNTNHEQQPEEEAHSFVEGAMDRVHGGVEGSKDKVADSIGSAADAMRGHVEGDGTVAKVGTLAADSLEKTAGYLRDHESGELWADLQEYVKQHPASALVGALAAGFVLSRIVR